MILFVVQHASGEWLREGDAIGVFPSMEDAQQAIAAREPDIVAQGEYGIHCIQSPRDAERVKLNLHWHITLEKFDGETGELLETIEREGVN